MNTLIQSTQQICNSIINSGLTPDNNEGKLTDAAISNLLNKLQNIFKTKKYIWSENNIIGIRMSDIFTDHFTDYGIITFGTKLYGFPISTKSGDKYLLNPEDKDGCACLLEGQYPNMWTFHNVFGGWTGDPYMQQVNSCNIIRQKNKKIGDSIDRTVTVLKGIFGINFHTWKSFNSPIIYNLSAGCQVMDENVLVGEILQYLKQYFNGTNTYTLLHINDFK